MAPEYVNRKGDRYFVLQGRTKTGKPKYYCSRKPGDNGVEQLPPEFEIYEHPESALVSVRKVKPSRLLDSEIEFLRDQTGKLAGVEHFKIDRSGDSLVIYLCDRDPDKVSDIMERMFGAFARDADSDRQWTRRNARYSPMFRFTLTDADERLFKVERWCYRGRIDGWRPLARQARALDELAADCLPHLARESFFELM